MKIALCLHGQLRDYHKAVFSWKRFIDKYDPDIYWHTWNTPPLYEAFFHNLKAGLVEAPKEYYYYGVTEYASSARNVYPQIDSINKSLSFLPAADECYDFVVRSRFDLVLHNPTAIDFDTLNPEKFYICSNHWKDSPDIFDDNIMVGSYENINRHNRIEWYLRNHWLDNLRLIPSGEQLLYTYFQDYDLMKHLVRTEALDFTLARNL